MLVSIITPTTLDRYHFNNRIKDIVKRQTYKDIEHLIDHRVAPIGQKRNDLCEYAKGEIIIHMDSDDMYADDWVERSVAYLKKGWDMTGLKSAYFASDTEAWLYQFKGSQPYVCGATMCYWKAHWERFKFKPYISGEDTAFCALGGKIKAHDYIDGFVATIHDSNTCSHMQVQYMDKIDRGLIPVLG